MHAAISWLLSDFHGQTDIESLNCEIKLSKEKSQTHNTREHDGNKEATDNQVSRIVQHRAREQRSYEEAH
jgi:hypothetical protein